MTDERDRVDRDAVAATVRESRLAYGAILTDRRVTVVECADLAGYERSGEDPALAMTTALYLARESVAEVVADAPADRGNRLAETAAPHLLTDREPPRLTDFERAAAAVPDARACALVVDAGAGDWRRVRDVSPADFDEHDPLDGTLVVARTVYSEADDRFRRRPVDLQLTVENAVDPGDGPA